ncbi:MAG TPA: nicotinate-nicotinamide nucleotide adenylyltransferase [Thermopetrobacter sp.]|nr:nicotinate-nicotinamide nucleotide adenylyltransferase [Thermopetrobacter sp.]
MLRLPPFAGLRVGLFGGSFNPPHTGHLALARHALKRLRLDHVWWLVAGRNPLKSPEETAALAARLVATRRLVRHPRFHVLALEAATGTLYTADLLAALAPLLSRGRFVWLMGADSFATLHRWKDWRRIMLTLPVAVFARPGWTLAALEGPAARAFARRRLPATRAAALADAAPPAWCYLEMPRRAVISTCLRHPERCQPSGKKSLAAADPAAP